MKIKPSQFHFLMVDTLSLRFLTVTTLTSETYYSVFKCV